MSADGTESYDLVIVGAGLAGATTARVLAEREGGAPAAEAALA